MAQIIGEQLRQLLHRWQTGELTEREVHETAEAMLEQLPPLPVYPASSPQSIPMEVLYDLDILNHQLITAADIPALLAFLDTPPGHEPEGWRKLQVYWEGINFDQRRQALADNPYYATSRRS